MKGLLLKELYLVRTSLKLNVILYTLWAISSGIITSALPNPFGIMMLIFSAYNVTAKYTIDEKCKWNRTQRTLPFSSKIAVGSSFVSAYIFLSYLFSVYILSTVIFSVLGHTLDKISWKFMIMFTFFSFDIIFIALIIFIAEKYNANKSGMLYSIVLCLTLFIGGLIASDRLHIPKIEWSHSLIIFVTACVLSAVIYHFTVKAYKKEKY